MFLYIDKEKARVYNLEWHKQFFPNKYMTWKVYRKHTLKAGQIVQTQTNKKPTKLIPFFLVKTLFMPYYGVEDNDNLAIANEKLIKG